MNSELMQSKSNTRSKEESKMKLYRAKIIDCDGEERLISAEALETTAATKHQIREWCSKHGHQFIEESYREITHNPDPAFVEACLGDIAGFKR